ncbi:hypothetical protein F2Q70_00043604 [Brassica cretica]|uniref:Uncharacterized protein n=1 Tax=Brassica cretica TaxID=69181 RepID=A0A3N6TGB3_BRACR|nr:hypothetical protein F2Q70_00043604 [Brassica cretica]KAF3568111.1 hypothetical protein DY000_02013401 [Brassica cretica]
MLPDHLEGEDQGLIAIIEKTSDPTDSGTRGQRYKELGIVPEKQNSGSFQEPEESLENRCRPLRMVSCKTLRSCFYSQDLVLTGPSSPTSHRQNHQEPYQVSASGLTDKQVGHEYSKETSSKDTSDGSGAKGTSQT